MQSIPLGTIYEIKLGDSVVKRNHGPHALEGLLKSRQDAHNNMFPLNSTEIPGWGRKPRPFVLSH